MATKKSAGKKVTTIRKKNDLETQHLHGLTLGTEKESLDNLHITELPAKLQYEPPPAAPSPLVVSLQGQIASIVEGRASVVNQISAATRQLQFATAELKSLQDMLRQGEDEVQYRMSLIAQAEGRPATQGWLSGAARGDVALDGVSGALTSGGWPYPSAVAGMGSIPGTPQSVVGQQLNPGFAGAGSIPAPTPVRTGQSDPRDVVNRSVVSDEERFG